MDGARVSHRHRPTVTVADVYIAYIEIEVYLIFQTRTIGHTRITLTHIL